LSVHGPRSGPKSPAMAAEWAYALEDGKKQEIHVLTLGAAVPDKVCDNCTEPWDWSSDGHYLLYRTGLPRKIGVVGSTAGGHLVLHHPEYSLTVPRFSPDDRWVAFSAGKSGASGDASRLFIAPFRGTAEVPFAEWQVVSDSPDWLRRRSGNSRVDNVRASQPLYFQPFGRVVDLKVGIGIAHHRDFRPVGAGSSGHSLSKVRGSTNIGRIRCWCRASQLGRQ
jgi:hypothetical protein